MISRLMLNLRVDSDQVPQREAQVGQRTSFVQDNFDSYQAVGKRTMEETIMGNLGAEVSYWAEDERKDDGEEPSDEDVIELTARYDYFRNMNGEVESEGVPRQSW